MGLTHLEISAEQSLRLLIRAIASAAASCTDTCRCFRPTSTIFFHLGGVGFPVRLSSLKVMDFPTKRQAAATMSSFRVLVKELFETWATSLQTWICPKNHQRQQSMEFVNLLDAIALPTQMDPLLRLCMQSLFQTKRKGYHAHLPCLGSPRDEPNPSLDGT
jgi:hypothetical protein